MSLKTIQRSFPDLIVDSRYKLVSELGMGTSAYVFLADDLEQPGLRRALKILRPEQNDDEESVIRFQREFEIASTLRHPNIVQVYECKMSEKGLWYSVIDYLPCGNLIEKVSRQPENQMPFDEAIKVLLEVSKAVAFLHSKKIIHRDLKPENILFTQDGHAQITDFGISRREQESMHLTSHGQIIGSPYYMAPEQGRGQVVSYATDVYALGVIAFEMVMGRVPFEGESIFQVVKNHCSEPMPELCVKDAGVPCWFENFIKRATTKNASLRISDAKEFYSELRVTITRLTTQRTPKEKVIDFIRPNGAMCTYLRNRGVSRRMSRAFAASVVIGFVAIATVLTV